jgi:ribosomal protein S18 acetylase RimI-like enzyme
MNSPAPAIRLAGPDDIDTVADIVATAFVDLDVIRFLVPDDARRLPVSRAWYRIYIDHAINGAGQVVMTDDGSAAAVWFDRTVAFCEPPDYAKNLADLAGHDLPQFEHLDAQMDALHPHDPHWHLLFLAVHPAVQRRGLGSALMNHTHRQLVADGICAYLEATGKWNRDLYLRHGYTDMAPATIPIAGDTVLYRMWRPSPTADPESSVA